MQIRTLLIFIVSLIAFTSCKTYETVYYKGPDISKIGDIKKYKVYVHAPKALFKVTDASLTAGGLKGDAEAVKDSKEIMEISNPATRHLQKKHSHDLEITTKKEIADSLTSISLTKADITECRVIASHSKINWENVGDIATDILGVAVCLAVIGALVYWFGFI